MAKRKDHELTHVALVPSKSRGKLQGHRFGPAARSGWLLQLPLDYSRLFELSFPQTMAESRHGFVRVASSSQRIAYFPDPSHQQLGRIERFLKHYESVVLLGLNRHISPFFESELDHCIALDFNKPEPGPARTEMGELEYLAKYKNDRSSIDQLADRLADAVKKLPVQVFPKPRRLTFIPSERVTSLYLPARLARKVHARIPESFWGCTQPFLVASITGEKPSAKNLRVRDKIELWNRLIRQKCIQISRSVEGYSVCVLDDLYQSGATLWSFAKYLKGEGAPSVVGVACVKSLRDTDNQ